MLVNIKNNGEVTRKEFRLVCHRGGRGFGPENTLQALGAALEFGVEMVETDVRSTRDGVPVIHHSPFLGIHLLNRMDMAEVRERAPDIPTLEEYMNLAAEKCSLNIEVKRCEVELLIEVMMKMAIPPAFLVSSFDLAFLEDFKKTGFPAHTGLLSQYELDSTRAAREALACGADVILPVSFYTRPGLIKTAHEAGLMVIPWTVNSSDGLQIMIAMGADGVITDSYEEFDAFLKSVPYIGQEEHLLNTG
jgi:glycerophosphoryl diester phosphodiesterase